MADTNSIEQRADVALDAVYEIEALSITLLERVASDPQAGDPMQSLVLRGMGMRMRELSRIAMTALSESNCGIDALRARVTGMQ